MMAKNTAVPKTTPQVEGGKTRKNKHDQAASQKNVFLYMALNMSWQLAVVVLLPVIAGAKLDKAVGTSNLYVFIGLALAAAGSVIVIWRAMQTANRLPVPKLTDAERRKIQKQYEEDDEDA